MLVDLDNAYMQEDIAAELKIKTHYESLDIAGSKKIHYLHFKLPAVIADIDKQLQMEIEQDALIHQAI